MMRNVCLSFAAALILCCSSVPVYAQTLENEVMDYLKILEGKIKKNPPPTGTVNDLKELKNSREKYVHFFDSAIAGNGTVKTVWKYWFDTEKTMFLKHNMKAVLGETITSTEDEINQGILKSEYSVQLFQENLLFANAKHKIGYLDSQDIMKFIKWVAVNKGDGLTKISNGLIAAGIYTLCTPELIVSKAVSIVSLAVGGGLKLIDIAIDKFDKATNEDGTYRLSKDDVKKNFPGYEDCVIRLARLEGTKIFVEWRCGKGFTKIDIKPGPKWEKDGKNAKEDLEILAKMIYRTNPLNSDKILPKNCRKFNFEWSIDPSEIAGMLMTRGAEYDSVTGTIYVKNRGKTQKESPAEEAITGNKHTWMTEVGTSAGRPSKVHLVSTSRDKHDAVASFTPSGRLFVVTDKDKQGMPLPEYVARVELSGKFDSEIKRPGSLLKKVSLDKVDVDVRFTYEQVRSVQVK